MACGLNKLPWDGGSSTLFFPDNIFSCGQFDDGAREFQFTHESLIKCEEC
jgi:hypothetical protein